MSAIHSKSAFIYGKVRRGLQSGRYVPGQRIDPASLASEFRISPTPVRFALYRLVGEGLLSDQSRNGLHVPLFNEIAMRDMYDWMEHLLTAACEAGATSRRHPVEPLPAANDDLVKHTWQLFDAIAGASGKMQLHHAVRRANDQLAPIRRAKRGLIENAEDELLQLSRLWQTRDTFGLSAALHDYHERRKQLVPCIVAMLSEGSDYPN